MYAYSSPSALPKQLFETGAKKEAASGRLLRLAVYAPLRGSWRAKYYVDVCGALYVGPSFFGRSFSWPSAGWCLRQASLSSSPRRSVSARLWSFSSCSARIIHRVISHRRLSSLLSSLRASGSPLITSPESRRRDASSSSTSSSARRTSSRSLMPPPPLLLISHPPLG